MLTVVPSRRDREKVSPAGTVNPLMFTVVHLTASSTSSRDEIVPVQSVAAGAPRTACATARSAARRRNEDTIVSAEEQTSAAVVLGLDAEDARLGRWSTVDDGGGLISLLESA